MQGKGGCAVRDPAVLEGRMRPGVRERFASRTPIEAAARSSLDQRGSGGEARSERPSQSRFPPEPFKASCVPRGLSGGSPGRRQPSSKRWRASHAEPNADRGGTKRCRGDFEARFRRHTHTLEALRPRISHPGGSRPEASRASHGNVRRVPMFPPRHELARKRGSSRRGRARSMQQPVPQAYPTSFLVAVFRVAGREAARLCGPPEPRINPNTAARCEQAEHEPRI